jgi:IclR family pca regulon transcriptional regulator
MTIDLDNTAEKPRDFVGAVAHVITVLRAFNADHAKMTLSDVSKRTGLDRAGARRYLLSLAHLGYVAQEEKFFRLTPKVLELGYAYMATIPLSEMAQRFLDKITQQTGETSAVAILDRHHIVHVARTNANRMLAPTITIGRRFPALYTSTGRVLVALQGDLAINQYLRELGAEKVQAWNKMHNAQLDEELKKIRKKGFATVDQEVEEGVRSLAVPIFDAANRPIAALNILTAVANVTKKKLLDEFLPILQQAASELQSSLISR